MKFNVTGLYSMLFKVFLLLTFFISSTNFLAAQPQTGFSFVPATNNSIVSSTNCFQISGSFTIEMWVKVTSTQGNWSNIFHLGNSETSGIRLYFYPGSSQLHYRVATTSNMNDGCDSSTPLTLNVWNHIAMRGSSSSLSLYINGVLVCTKTSSPLLLDLNTIFYSSSPWYLPSNAQISEIRLWNIERTQNQIQAAMNCQSPPQSNLTFYYGGPILNPGISISISAGSQTICPGSSVTFTATAVNAGASPMYQWKRNNVNVGTNSISYTTSGIANNDQISCTLSNPILCNATSVSNTITMSTAYTWTGAVSRAWLLPANWSCNAVPPSGANIVIPVTANQPIID